MSKVLEKVSTEDLSKELRRRRKEKQKIRDTQIKDFAKKLAEIVDSFERETNHKITPYRLEL